MGSTDDPSVLARPSAPICRECGRERKQRMKDGTRNGWEGARGLCNSCWKRLVWRPRNGAAVDRDRAASRDWKRRARAAGYAG